MARRSCTSYSRSPPALSPRSMRTICLFWLSGSENKSECHARLITLRFHPLPLSSISARMPTNRLAARPAVLRLEETAWEKGCPRCRNSIPVLLAPPATRLKVIPEKAPRRLDQLLSYRIVGCHALPLPQLVG
eukprot:scaffold5810_cov112-Isochrysis_galbana.AAC.6